MEEKNNSKKGINKGNKNSTKSVAKKTSTKKVVNNAKKTTPNKQMKKVEEVKKVEVTKTTKPTTEEKVVTIKKARKESFISKVGNKLSNDIPFLISSILCIILAISLVLVFILSGIPKTKNGNQIVASIKGKTITADDLYSSLKGSYGMNTMMNDIDKYIASKMVTSDEDIKEAKEYVNGVIDYYKKYAEQYGVDFDTFLVQYVGISGVTTEDEFSNYVLKDYKKTLAVRNYLATTYSEKKVKKYYDDNYSKSMTVRHILIEVENDDEDAAKKQAKELISELNKVKDDKEKLEKKFKDLAYDNSADSTYSNGGLLENFAKADVAEEFWEASSKLKDGKFTTEAVKTEYGYHIIFKVSSNEGKKYNEVKDECRKKMAKAALEKDTNLSVTTWDKLRTKYKLKINDKNMKKEYEKTLKNYK